MATDWRDDRIAAQDAVIASQAAIIASQAAQLASQTEQIAALVARVTELEEKLRASSRNSSKSPSSDGPAVSHKPKKVPTGRKPVGQPGHERNRRELVPPEQVRKTVDCLPGRCGQCTKPLRGRDPEPRRHQVTHLPPVVPVTDEFRMHALRCDDCGHTTVGKLPVGIPTGSFGPSVVAVSAVLMGPYRMSKRLVQGLVRDLCGLEISLGAIVGCQDIVSDALEAPMAEAKKFSRSRR